MREGLGLYSGQLSQFAIVQDEEPHKPIYLIDVWYRKDRSMPYEQVEADGLMIDLADAVTLSVRQVDLSSAAVIQNDPPTAEIASSKGSPTKDEITELAYNYWIQQGCQDGHAEEDWLRAERELTNSQESSPSLAEITQ